MRAAYIGACATLAVLRIATTTYIAPARLTLNRSVPPNSKWSDCSLPATRPSRVRAPPTHFRTPSPAWTALMAFIPVPPNTLVDPLRQSELVDGRLLRDCGGYGYIAMPGREPLARHRELQFEPARCRRQDRVRQCRGPQRSRLDSRRSAVIGHDQRRA